VCACLLSPHQQHSNIHQSTSINGAEAAQAIKLQGGEEEQQWSAAMEFIKWSTAMEYSSPLVVLPLQQQYTETEFSACSLAFYKRPAEQVSMFNL
jgi:hypothetical protein